MSTFTVTLSAFHNNMRLFFFTGANNIGSSNNRHSVAMSDASSSSRWGNPAIICSDSEWASDDEVSVIGNYMCDASEIL